MSLAEFSHRRPSSTAEDYILHDARAPPAIFVGAIWCKVRSRHSSTHNPAPSGPRPGRKHILGTARPSDLEGTVETPIGCPNQYKDRSNRQLVRPQASPYSRHVLKPIKERWNVENGRTKNGPTDPEPNWKPCSATKLRGVPRSKA